MVGRLFDRIGVDDPDVAVTKLDGFRRWALVTLAFEAGFALRYEPYSAAPFAHGLVTLGFVVCLAFGWSGRFVRPALASAALLELALVVTAFPDNANHQFLALVCLVLLLLVGSSDASDPASSASPADAIVCLQSIRWIVVGGLFWAGLAKLVSGYWLDGEFLTYRVAIDPGFARVFSWLIPPGELARLVTLENQPGAGPFRVDAPLLVLVSNLTWVAELLLPAALLVPRTRAAAVWVTLALLAAIEAGAWEVFFAGWMVAGLLLFLERDRLSPLLPVLVVGYAVFWWSVS